jgi:hypothetical protein
VQGDAGYGPQGHLYVRRPGRHGGEVGGPLELNIYAAPPGSDPDETSALDGYEAVWEIRTTARSEQGQIDEARRLFDDIVAKLPYQALLTHGMSILVAAWSPKLGLTEFPPGTSVDIEDKEHWAPYALPAVDPHL